MNQKTYLKEIADAIREKEETTEPIQAKQFAQRIRNMQIGGFLVTIEVQTSPGATCTASLENSDQTVSDIANEEGKCILKITQPGKWEVIAYLDGKSSQPVIYDIKDVYSGTSVIKAGELSLHGSSITLTSKTVTAMGAVTGNGIFIIAGGSGLSGSTSVYYKTTTGISTGYTKTTNPATLSNKRNQGTAGSIEGYALFIGGQSGASTSQSNFDAYDSSLTLHKSGATLSTGHSQGAAVTTPTKIFVAGGYKGSTKSSSDIVEIIEGSNLTVTTKTSLSEARYSLGGASTENYILFAGGKRSNTRFNTIDIYDKNTGTKQTSALTLQEAREYCKGVEFDGLAWFPGGLMSSSPYNSSSIDKINDSLTKETTYTLSTARQRLGVGVTDDFLMIAGGSSQSSLSTSPTYTFYNTIDVFDKGTQARVPGFNLPYQARDLVGVSADNTILFAGGYSSTESYTNKTTCYKEK